MPPIERRLVEPGALLAALLDLRATALDEGRGRCAAGSALAPDGA